MPVVPFVQASTASTEALTTSVTQQKEAQQVAPTPIPSSQIEAKKSGEHIQITGITGKPGEERVHFVMYDQQGNPIFSDYQYGFGGLTGTGKAFTTDPALAAKLAEYRIPLRAGLSEGEARGLAAGAVRAGELAQEAKQAQFGVRTGAMLAPIGSRIEPSAYKEAADISTQQKILSGDISLSSKYGQEALANLPQKMQTYTLKNLGLTSEQIQDYQKAQYLETAAKTGAKFGETKDLTIGGKAVFAPAMEKYPSLFPEGEKPSIFGEVAKMKAYEAKKYGTDIVDLQGRILLSASETKTYDKALLEAQKGIGSDAAKEKYALIQAIGKEKYDRATEILKSREEERLYQEGKGLSLEKGLAISIASPDVLQKEISQVYTRAFGTPAEKITAARETQIARASALEGYKGLTFEQGLVKVGLESPLTTLLPVGVEAKAGIWGAEALLKGSAKQILGVEAAEAIGKQRVIEIAGKEIAKGTATELFVGTAFTGMAAADILGSKTTAEAVGKAGLLGIELPSAAIGFEGTGIVGKRVGEAMPTSREFFRFVVGKAEPTKGLRNSFKFISEKTPDFVKQITEVKTREPKPSELLTSKAYEIYKKVSPEAQKIILESTKIAKKAEELPRSATLEMAKEAEKQFSFATTRDIGERGLEIKSILEKHPEDIVVGSLGSSRFIKEFREAETTLPSGKVVKARVGDIELASDFAKKYEDLDIKGLDIHGVTKGKFAFGTPGERITTPFGGETISLTKGKIMKPVRVEKISYQDPLEQFYRKIEGGTKYISRKTDVITDEMIRSKEYNLEDEMKGFSSRRGKDVPDIVKTSQAFAEKIAKYYPKEGQKYLESAKKIKEAEATKLYSGLPIEEYGYEFATRYGEVLKEKPLLPVVYKRKDEGEKIVKVVSSYYPSASKPKSPLEYYPTQTKVVEKIVGYYPSTTKPEKYGYYPSGVKKAETPVPVSGYPTGYPSGYIPQPKYPRPYLDQYWNEELKTEIPQDLVVLTMNKDGEKEIIKRKKKQIEQFKYEGKKRISPIFETGSEKVYAIPDVSFFPKTTQERKKPVKHIKSKPTFDFGGVGFTENPLGKTNKVNKVKKSNNNKKPNWL